MSDREITLQELLASRDARRDRQQEYLNRYKGSSLVLLTVVMPGSVKRNHLSLKAAQAARDALRKTFAEHIVCMDIYDLKTGYEAFLMTDISPRYAKELACSIEDTHPLGRLFDIDVMVQPGNPLSRTALGLQPRRCLICGNDARVCMRTGQHDYAQLLQHIESMISRYDDTTV